MSANLFSDDWFRVSTLHIGLLDSVNIYQQIFKNELWYMFEDIHNNKYYRVKENTYKFIKSLDSTKSIEENWLSYIEKYPTIAPTQEDVISILTQLHSNNILFFKNKGQSQYIFNKYIDKKKKELQQKIQGFLFIKIPVFNPNKLLEFVKPLEKIIFSSISFIVWLSVILFALNLIVINHNEIFSQTQGMLSPTNLFILYVSMFVLKLFHELAHGIATKKYGGNIYTFGLMFIVFTPLPYVDASNSWAFKNKWERIIVSVAGMYIELFIAGLATIIWANTGDGLTHSIAFNIMVAGSVSSILFNANPLLKFDSYFILSDLLEIPNLYQKSHDYTLAVMEKRLFNLDSEHLKENRDDESIWLLSYGILSYVYKLFLTFGIVIFVADQWFEIGVVIFLISFYTMIAKPIYTFIKFVLYSPRLYQNRQRAKNISLLFLVIFFYFLFYFPVYDTVKTNGIIDMKIKENIYLETPAILDKVMVQNGQKVTKGELLFQFTNQELDLEILKIKLELDVSLKKKLKALNQTLSYVKPIDEKIDFLNEKLSNLKKRKQKLNIRAKSNGIVILENNIKSYLHFYVKNRTKIADIISKDNYEFISIVSQEEAVKLFEQNLSNAKLKLTGDISTTINLINTKIIPHEKNELPSMALSWNGGGDFETIATNENKIKTAESFFELRSDIDYNKNITYFQGQYGTIKIILKETTFYTKLSRYILQIMQKRYRL